MVQRRAARFVLGDYNRTSSVTDMLDKLKWDTLEQRREMQCLSAFHKVLNGKLDLDINRYAVRKLDRPRRTHNQE